jgi:hypothetical protein
MAIYRKRQMENREKEKKKQGDWKKGRRIKIKD